MCIVRIIKERSAVMRMLKVRTILVVVCFALSNICLVRIIKERSAVMRMLKVSMISVVVHCIK